MGFYYAQTALQFLLLVAATAVDGFSMTKTTSATAAVGQRPTTSLWASVVESNKVSTDESRMTLEDEDILFGDYDEKSNRKSSTGGGKKPTKINTLDKAKDPLVNKLQTMRDNLQSCLLWADLADICPDKRAVIDKSLCDEKIDVTFAQMFQLVRKSAAVFAKFGICKGVNVAILAENSARWLMVDHGIQMAGGASAVRGADAPIDELRYIYEHSDSAGVAVLQGPRLLLKMAKDAKKNKLDALGLFNEKNGPVQHIILINREKKSDEDIANMVEGLNVQVHIFGDLIAAAKPIDMSLLPKVTRDDLSTIVYTSGTTGSPKGVMLTHGNVLHQLSHRLAPSHPYEESEPLPGETMVSILPVWHITERTFELWMFARGCNVVYSSIRTFKKDLALHKPQWIVLVPRVLEKIAMGVQDKFSSGSAAVKTLSSLFTKTSTLRATNRKIANQLVVGEQPPSIFQRLASSALVGSMAPLNAVGDKLVWSKVKEGFGGNLKVIISGGSALSGSLESFYEAAGISIAVGYGLTECSPLVAFRRTDENLITAGCVGKPTEDTDLRVVDPSLPATSERPALPVGEVGVVLARGPQVMKGYYKNQKATDNAIDKFGWFNTGDLGRINPATGDLILTGRAKDTIVLSNGENIEPQPIEDAIMESPMIEQIMLMGQDGRRIVAIAVLNLSEMVNGGYLTKEKCVEAQEASEKMNDPKCSEEESEALASILQSASKPLRSNAALKSALMADIKRFTSTFRKWEQVGDVYVTLEPFAMVNGQLTQSYKVKRPAVAERYADELPK